MHIVISVKDFKAIVTHAETLRVPISAHFSYPTRPLQFSYQSAGIHSEFTLMTTGDYRGASATPNPHFVSNRSGSRQPSVAVGVPGRSASVTGAPSRSASEMPPPPRPVAKPPLSQSARGSLGQGRPKRDVEPQPEPDDGGDSLFIPQGDDDHTWDPPNYDQDDGGEMLGWDASNDHPAASFHPTFRDSASSRQQQHETAASQEGFEPTQRLSQVSRLVRSRVERSADPCSSMACLTECEAKPCGSSFSRRHR